MADKMNKVEKLINELCPDGVEYKELGEVAEYVRGLTYSKKDETLSNDGLKVLRANNITLSTHTLNFDDVKIISKNVKVRENQKLFKGDILISAASGSKAHVGKVAYIEKDLDYCFGGFMAVIRVSSKINSRFLFHLLIGETFSKYLEKSLSTTTINNLGASIMNKFKIPIPPLPIQKEIVKILDTFTEFEEELEAELEAELGARKKQYEYYSDDLLTFGDEVEWRELGEVCEIGDGLHGTPKFNPLGKYYFINGNNLKNGNLKFDENTKMVDKEMFIKHGIEFFTDKTLFMSINGTIGNVAFFRGENIVLGKSVAYFNLKSKSLNLRYLYYIFQTTFAKNYYEIQKTGSTIKNLGLKALRKFKIPIPPLSKQKEIVAILDKFDALVNDISQGLPAEIEARRQQYEYYRNKLLTFKEKKGNK